MKYTLTIFAVLVLSLISCGELNSMAKRDPSTNVAEADPSTKVVETSPKASPLADKPIEEKFFDYVTSKGKSYKALKEYQEDAEFHLKSGHLLSMAWFYKGEIRIAMIFMVDNFGNYVLVKNLFAWETKNVKKGKLTPEKLQQIKDAINRIKEEKSAPEMGREYYLAYRKGLRWKSDVYDISKLPGYIGDMITAAGINEDFK